MPLDCALGLVPGCVLDRCAHGYPPGPLSLTQSIEPAGAKTVLADRGGMPPGQRPLYGRGPLSQTENRKGLRSIAPWSGARPKQRSTRHGCGQLVERTEWTSLLWAGQGRGSAGQRAVQWTRRFPEGGPARRAQNSTDHWVVAHDLSKCVAERSQQAADAFWNEPLIEQPNWRSGRLCDGRRLLESWW